MVYFGNRRNLDVVGRDVFTNFVDTAFDDGYLIIRVRSTQPVLGRQRAIMTCTLALSLG